MLEMETSIFESTLESVKTKVQIIPKNFQKTYNHHLGDKKKQEVMS